MKKDIVFKREFVEFIPEELEDGTLYVSIKFATASHLCCCGCGNKVVTPLRPTDWKLIFDGKTISLDPSIGNWSFPCQSHYWVRNSRVKWAPHWTTKEIELGRSRDRYAKEGYFGIENVPADIAARDGAVTPESARRRSFWRKLKWCHDALQRF